MQQMFYEYTGSEGTSILLEPCVSRIEEEDLIRERVYEQSGVGETVIVGLAKNDVVEDPDAEDLRRFNQAASTVTVFPRGSRISARVVMDEDDRSSAVQQCGLETFTRMHDRGRQTSNADRMVADGSVLAVKRDHEEVLAVKCRKFLPEALKKLPGVMEFRVFREGILRFPHKHYPVTGKNVLEFLHGWGLRRCFAAHLCRPFFRKVCHSIGGLGLLPDRNHDGHAGKQSLACLRSIPRSMRMLKGRLWEFRFDGRDHVFIGDGTVCREGLDDDLLNCALGFTCRL